MIWLKKALEMLGRELANLRLDQSRRTSMSMRPLTARLVGAGLVLSIKVNAMMRFALSDFLLDVHLLLRDNGRERGVRPGVCLERDLEALAHSRWLHTERRVRRGPHGGVYYSGLAPETDLFVYDGPQFLHVEAKDLSYPVGRAVPTEFWARALDLHLGRTRDTFSELPN